MQFKNNITNLVSIQDQYQAGLKNFKMAKSKMFNTNLHNPTNPNNQTQNKLFLLNQDQAKFVSKFSGMRLEQIKNSLEKNLQVLDLSNNRFTFIPKEVYMLKQLQNFQINNNFIENLPNDFFEHFTQLTALGLSNNLLISLPKGLDHVFQSINSHPQLQLLDTLLLSYNRLQLLDPDIWKLQNLSTLLIQGNEYQSLSFKILQFKHTLKVLGFGWPQLLDASCPILIKDYHLQIFFHILDSISVKIKSSDLDFFQYLDYIQNDYRFDEFVIQPRKGDESSLEFQHSQESFNEHIEDRHILNNLEEPNLKLEQNQDQIISDPNFTKSQYVPTNTIQSQLIESQNSRFGVDRLDSQADKLNINYILSSPLETVEENKEESITIKQNVNKKSVFNLNIQNEIKQNLMHLAILTDEVGVLRLLILKAKYLMDQIDEKNHTPLSLSIERQKFRVTGFLLLNGANVKIGGGQKYTNLHLSGLLFQGELAKDLINYGIDPNVVDNNGDTVLHCVARSIQHQKVTEFFQLMLNLQTKIYLTNNKGQTCIELLVEKGNLNTLKFLNSQSKLKINFEMINQKSGKSLIHIAIQNYHLNVFLYFVNEGLISLLNISQYIDIYSFLMTVLFKFPGKNFAKLKIIMKFLLIKKKQELRQRFQVANQNNSNKCLDYSQDNSFDDYLCSNEDCEGLAQSLQKLNAIQPKFKNSNLSLKLNDSDPETPTDEFQHMTAKENNNKSQTKSSSRVFDQQSNSQSSRLSRQLIFNFEKPRQINLSPNNIGTIRERNNLLQSKSPIQTLEFNMGMKNLRSFVQSLDFEIQSQIGKKDEKSLDQFVDREIIKFKMGIMRRYLKKSQLGQLFQKGNKIIDPQLWENLEKIEGKWKSINKGVDIITMEQLVYKDKSQMVFDYERIQQLF